MRFTFVRGFAIVAAFALAACGGRTMVPMSQPASGFPAFDNVAPSTSDPCPTLSKDGLWYFHGPCLAEDVKKSSTEFKFKGYKGITQTVKYPAVSGSVAANTTFVTAEGTGNSDITGTFSGEKFPIYGSKDVKCLGASSSSEKCAGKAVVYDLLVNASTNSVTFTGSPSIALTAPTVLKHKHQCTLNQFIQSRGYQVTPVQGKIEKGAVTLPVDTFSFHLNSHTIEVFAVSCM
jgi:hypothetical protein